MKKVFMIMTIMLTASCTLPAKPKLDCNKSPDVDQCLALCSDKPEVKALVEEYYHWQHWAWDNCPPFPVSGCDGDCEGVKAEYPDHPYFK